MKIPRKIKEMPWPEPFRSETKQHYRIVLSWPVIDHERLMVATFLQNVNRSSCADFRLICSKKLPAAAILFKGETRGKRKDLQTASCVNAWSTYPEISEQDEKALGKWLGAKFTRNHFLPELYDWVNEAIRAEVLRERDARGEIRDEDVDLCPEELPEGLERFILGAVLPNDKVLIYTKGNTRGFCYSCGHKVHARRERFKQSEIVRCPDCGETVVCYLNTSDRFHVDYVENIASIQKGTDGRTLFIRQWHLKRDTTGLWLDIPGHLEEICRYAIRGNRVAKWQRENKENWHMNTYRYHLTAWTRMHNPSVVYDGSYYFYSPHNWREAFSGTSLQYCNLSEYVGEPNMTRRNRNPIRFLMDWAQYPMVEKFWKAGYTHLVHERVAGLRKEHRYIIRWNKDSFREALHFPMRLLKIHTQENWTMADIAKVKELWGHVQAGSIQEKDVPELARSMATTEHIWYALGHASVHRILQYIGKNVEQERARRKIEKEKAERLGRSYWEGRPFDTPGTYRDYLKDCIALKLNLDDREVLFPPDLNAAHARTISQVKYKKSEAKRELFTMECRRLKWMEWEQDGLLIRLPQDAAELIAEGQYLHHCVAGYADRMADGKTTILLIRRVEAPEVPFYTLEWLNGRVQQCRTLRNADYRDDEPVLHFVEEWIKKVVNKRKKKAAQTAA